MAVAIQLQLMSSKAMPPTDATRWKSCARIVEPEFKAWNKRLTLAGHVVITLAVYPSDEDGKEWYTPTQKETLDLVHLQKIDAADEVLILNVGGYVGASTRRELAWARLQGNDVFWLEEPDEGVREHEHLVAALLEQGAP